MKRFFQKTLAIALSLLTCFSVVACNKDEAPSPSSPSSGNNSESEGTGKYIVSEGISDYTILMPVMRDENLNFAIEELQYGIEATCGYKMAATENYVAGKKYLSVGETELYEINKAAVDGDGLEKTELRVLTVGDDVIMIGEDNEYSVYAVYHFMEKTFGFKWYTFEDAYVEKSSSIELLDLDETDKPDIARRTLYEWDYWVDEVIKRNRRMRTQDFAENFYIDGHSTMQIIPKLKYVDTYPEWFSVPNHDTSFGGAGQLCLSNEAMYQEFIKNSKELILKDWDNDYFQIGMEDNWDYCKCDTCKARAASYNPAGVDDGNRAALWIIFANKVARELNAWVQTIEPGKVIYFPIYAYFYNVNPPVKEENGKYVPMSEDVIVDENVMIMYAPISNEFTYSFDDARSEVNTVLKKWGAVTNNMIIYSYAVPYGVRGWLPMNDLLTMGGSYTFAAENNYHGYIEEGQTYYRYPCMQKLKNYISSQLWWDSSRSLDEIAYEFIDFYYRPVAEEFKAYYSSLKQWQAYQINEMGFKVLPMDHKYSDEKYWPIDAMNHFSRMIDGILEKLLPLKDTNIELYETYFDRVNIEHLWVNYVYCSKYKKHYNDADYQELVDFMEKYTEKYKVLADATTKDLIASWRNS